MTTLPYGTWPSPITAQSLAVGGTQLGGPRFVGRQLWWTEGIAAEEGRQAIVRSDGPVESDAPLPQGRVTVLPDPGNARSRVHEYGGASWTVVPGTETDGQSPLVVLVDFADQRVHALREGEQPRPLTPHGPEVASAHGPSLRFADPTPVTLADGTVEVWWVCEDHRPDLDRDPQDPDAAPRIERYIAAVPLDGSAAEDPSRIRRITPASRFVAHPRLSPDGRRLAWISWEHPQMPWDGTELHVAELGDTGAGTGIPDGPVVIEDRVVDGDTATSVLQPEWLDEDRLVYLSDASGWWNPWTWSGTAGRRPVLDRAEEFGGAMWVLGMCWYHVLDADHLLVQHGTADTTLGILRISDGDLRDIDQPLTSIGVLDLRADGTVCLLGSSPTAFPAILVGHLEAETASLTGLRVLRASREDAPDPAVLPTAEPLTVPLPEGGEAHAILYRPHHEGYEAPAGELPPVVARVHGGPTSQVPVVLSLPVAYLTSRGIGVVEVNYGGSTGYGRAYRDRLQGQWGIVDVADTVAVMEHLVDQGLADPGRLGIEGGSAGGWTTLACLTGTHTFAAGVSAFGVADLEGLRRDTHDFESRYLDGLVGPWPERRDLYRDRAPLHQVDQLRSPVLLLQGEEDRIVPPAQSQCFADALAAQGIPHAYLLFAGEQHGFRRAETIIRAQEASLSFYGQVFDFEPPDVPVLPLERGEAANA